VYALTFQIHIYTIFVKYTLNKTQTCYNYSSCPWGVKVFKTFVKKVKFLTEEVRVIYPSVFVDGADLVPPIFLGKVDLVVVLCWL
jgi:hypothetical protein